MTDQTGTTFSQLLEQTGHVVYTTHGISMRPLLKQGRDVVNIVRRSEKRCVRYDAVLFLRDNGQYVLHRILKVFNDGYWIVGDNCVSGERVRENQVLGILVGINRNGKIISVSDFGYKLYLILWCKPWRLRIFLLRIIHFGMKCLRKIYRMVKGRS